MTSTDATTVAIEEQSANKNEKPTGKVRIDSATSLWRAAEHGDVGRLKMLLDAGHDVNAREEHDNRGEKRHKTPLSAAVDGNEPLAVRLLLRRGANPDLQDGDGDRYPLHWASAFGDHDECAELLVQAGASLDARDKDGHTPLEFARGSADGSVHRFSRLASTFVGKSPTRDKVIAVLDKAVAEAATAPPLPWSHERTKAKLQGTYWKAAASADLPTLEKCLGEGQPVDQPRPQAKSRMSALSIAAFNGKPAAVSLLLSYKADPNRTEPEGGFAPLHFCSYEADNHECAALLLAAGADPSQRKNDNETTCEFARRKGREATSALLFAAAERQRAKEALLSMLDRVERKAWLAPSAASLGDAISSARKAAVEELLIERGAIVLQRLQDEEASGGVSMFGRIAGGASAAWAAIPTAADAITSRDTEWFSSIAGGGTVTTGGGGGEQPVEMRNVVQPDDPEAAAVAPMEQAVDGEEAVVAKPELEKSSSGEAVEDEVMEEVELVDAEPPASTILGG